MICNFRAISEKKNFMHLAASQKTIFISVLVFGCTFKLFCYYPVVMTLERNNMAIVLFIFQYMYYLSYKLFISCEIFDNWQAGTRPCI